MPDHPTTAAITNRAVPITVLIVLAAIAIWVWLWNAERERALFLTPNGNVWCEPGQTVIAKGGRPYLVTRLEWVPEANAHLVFGIRASRIE